MNKKIIEEAIEKAAFNETDSSVYISMSRSFLAISRMEGNREGRTPGPPFVRVGRRVLYLKKDLDAWLAQHRVDPSEAA